MMQSPPHEPPSPNESSFHFTNPSSASAPVGIVSAQRRQCRGSLPLKKRRFHNHNNVTTAITTETTNSNFLAATTTTTETEITPSPHHSSQLHLTSSSSLSSDHHPHRNPSSVLVVPTLSTNTTTTNLLSDNSHDHHHHLQQQHVHADEKIAALALVAAATGNTNLLFSSGGSTSTNNHTNTNHDSSATSTTTTMSNSYTSTNATSAVVGSATVDNDRTKEQILIPSKQQKKPPHESNNNATTKTATTTTISKAPTQPRQRVHHPPLSSPIPGGCHGRTSRNNSYCRRTPCYNGSKYCKLHYQQYVVQGGADPNSGVGEMTTTTTSSTMTTTGGKKNSSTTAAKEPKANHGKIKGVVVRTDTTATTSSTLSTSTGTSTSKSISTTTSHRHHQDKRYTGLCQNDSQCLATTTRGRPCAYVAVSGHKYCHLHADYDTNPPPRRGGGGSAISAMNKAKPTLGSTGGGGKADSSTLNRILSCIPVSSQSSSTSSPLSSLSTSLHSNIKVPLQSNSSGISPANDLASTTGTNKNTTMVTTPASTTAETISTFNNSHTSKNKQSKESTIIPSAISLNSQSTTTASPPYPLLNSIPSDQWLHRLVLISTGPLVNHIGRVMKWGNGWITVSTMTGGGGGSGGGSIKNNSNSGQGFELLHNRRAIELYLLPKDINLENTSVTAISSSCIGTSTNVAGNATLVPKPNVKKQNKKEIKDSANTNPTTTALNTMSATSIITSATHNNKKLNKPRSVTEEDGDRGTITASPHQTQEEVDPIIQVDTQTKNPNPLPNTAAVPDKILPEESHEPIVEKETTKRTLVEELILAQMGGRNVKDIDLALCSGGRTIHKPERYEDSMTMPEKKRQRSKQQHGSPSPSPSKRWKQVSEGDTIQQGGKTEQSHQQSSSVINTMTDGIVKHQELLPPEGSGEGQKGILMNTSSTSVNVSSVGHDKLQQNENIKAR